MSPGSFPGVTEPIPMKAFLLLALALSLLAGCSSLASRKNPAVDFSRFKRFYVEHRITDDHGIDQLIVNDLHGRGRDAFHGHLTMIPEKIDVIIAYEDRWTWDFKSYLIELNIYARDARTNQLIAAATYRHPGPLSKDPKKMIRKILDSFFKP
jgi:hypothetical protein